jgi:putative hydrolase of the HAD superfamily
LARTKAVLFDLDHTLLDTRKAERRALEAALGSVSLPFSPAILAHYREINDEVWAAYRRGETEPGRLSRDRFVRLVDRIGASRRLAGRLSRTYLEAMSGRGDLLPGCRSVLRALTPRYALGVVTNGTDAVQRARLRASGLMSLFAVVVTSEESGFTKPDPRILGLALARLGVRPGEALYVGDDLEVDGGAARRARVPFLWLTASGKDFRPTVRSLAEIPPLLAARETA